MAERGPVSVLSLLMTDVGNRRHFHFTRRALESHACADHGVKTTSRIQSEEKRKKKTFTPTPSLPSVLLGFANGIFHGKGWFGIEIHRHW